MPPMPNKIDKKRAIKQLKKRKVKHFKCNRDIKIDKRKVDTRDSDIMNLPYVEFIDENSPPVEIKKHAIDAGTIYLPPSKNDEIEPTNIPWAKLYDIDEEIDGVVIQEPIDGAKENF